MDQSEISQSADTIADKNFVEVEGQYIREKIYPDFEWVTFEGPSKVNRLPYPVPRSRVAVVTTCGALLSDQPPFNLKSRIGDSSYREIPSMANLKELLLSHVGYNTVKASADKNCVFPLDRLREFEASGEIGSLASRHFSFMGYVAEAGPLLNETAPEVAAKLRTDGVDLVLLVPA